MAQEGFFRLAKNGDDWDLHNPEGKFAQKFEADKYGSPAKAEKAARRELENRNRRLARLRKGNQPPRGKHSK